MAHRANKENVWHVGWGRPGSAGMLNKDLM